MKTNIYFLLALFLIPNFSHSEFVVDKIIATVDATPITLSEYKKSFPDSSIEIDTLEAKQNYEKLILTKIINKQANKYRLSANKNDIENYIKNLSLQQGKTKQEILNSIKKMFPGNEEESLKLEILKGKLINKIFQETINVSQKEIDLYFSQNPHLKQAGTKIKLKHIFLSYRNKERLKVQELAKSIMIQLSGGLIFEKAVAEYSEAPDAAKNGLIGILSEEELNSDFFDALLSVKSGQFSEPVETDGGIHIFKVEERIFIKDTKDETLLKNIKNEIKSTKMQEKLRNYFTKEIYKEHVIERFL